MNKTRYFLFFSFLFMFLSVSAQKECSYNIYGLELDMHRHIGLDVGTLNSNNIYTGIQGTIPFNNRNSEFYMNCVYGYGYDFLFNSKFIVTGIFGVYSNNSFATVNICNINFGCGLTIVKKTVVIGCSTTNWEFFRLKIGFCPRILSSQ